ncbi:MAG: DNA-processing protein DprA [Anaerotignaceae bacterium]
MMWLFRSLGMNLRKTYILLEHFGSAMEIWNANEKMLLQISGVTPQTVYALSDGKTLVADWISELDALDLRYISINDRCYPHLLREIADPPVGLYIKGQLPDNDCVMVSVIGARRCTDYGRNMAFKLSKDLAKDGVITVSGMARGIDSMGHKGTLEANGKTIAVLGFGHKNCYPPENKSLMEEIGKTGCLISEYPPDTEATRYNFPQRNRIIAGISQGLIVVEAGKKSGTLITVDFALDDGRTVMTLPANITSKASEGTNELIKQGCPIVTCAEDVLFELGIEKMKKQQKNEEKLDFDLSDEEKKIYGLIGSEAVTLEHITKMLKMPVQDIQYILTMLELGAAIQKLPGDKYIRCL